MDCDEFVEHALEAEADAAKFQQESQGCARLLAAAARRADEAAEAQANWKTEIDVFQRKMKTKDAAIENLTALLQQAKDKLRASETAATKIEGKFRVLEAENENLIEQLEKFAGDREHFVDEMEDFREATEKGMEDFKRETKERMKQTRTQMADAHVAALKRALEEDCATRRLQ